MPQLKRLFQLAGTAVTLGSCLNPTSVDALTLTLTGQSSISTAKNCINFSSDSKMLKQLNKRRADCFSKSVSKVNNATISGRLISETDTALVNQSGAELEGNVLTLTAFSIYSPNDINILNLLTFNGDFPTPPSDFDFIVAFQNLNGDFTDITGNQVDPSDTVTFDGFINSPSLSGQRIIELQTQSAVPQVPPRVVDFNASDQNCGLRNSLDCSSAATTLTIIGQLNRLTLKAGEQLKLENSACIVVVAADENGNPVDEEGNIVSFDSQDAEENCRRVAGIPEPSSILSLLALGTLGTTSLLTRKRKVSQRSKD